MDIAYYTNLKNTLQAFFVNFACRFLSNSERWLSFRHVHNLENHRTVRQMFHSGQNKPGMSYGKQDIHSPDKRNTRCNTSRGRRVTENI